MDQTTFPFLKLPGEIRNMIYQYALVDTEYSVRFTGDISKKDGRNIVRRLYRARPGPPDRDDLPNQGKGSLKKACTRWKREQSFEQTTFLPNLFQVCRQIESESTPLFYGKNLFIFETVLCLYHFLVHFANRIPFIRRIGLASAVAPGTTIPPLATIFPLLVNASELEALYLHTNIWGKMSTRGSIAAGSFYRFSFPWLHAMIRYKKDPLTIIKLPTLETKTLKNPKWATSVSGQQEFLTAMASLLKRHKGNA